MYNLLGARKLNNEPKSKLSKSKLLAAGLLLCQLLSSAAIAEIDYGYNFFEANNITPEVPTYTTALLGDTIDPGTGSVMFEHTDVSIPGNSGLPVNFTRRLSNPGSWYQETQELENWSISIPHVRSTYLTEKNGDPKGAYWAVGKACTSQLNDNPDFNQWISTTNHHGRKEAYWGGDSVYIPGAGSVKFTEEEGDNTYKRHNNQNWEVECITQSNGRDGFKITTTDGHIYTFAQERLIRAPRDFNLSAVTMVTDTHCSGQFDIDCGITIVDSDSPSLARRPQYHIFMLATKIEDRFGNWVSYTYGTNGRLEKITSNDSRTIDINYSSDRVSSVVANGKTWSYSYDNNEYDTLNTVTRPDNKQWQFDHNKQGNSLWIIENFGRVIQNSYGDQCLSGGAYHYVDVTHPEGAKGEFNLTVACHGKSGVKKFTQVRPYPNSGETYWLPKASNLFSVSNKTLTLTDGETMSWSYDYSENEGLYGLGPIQAKHRLTLDVTGVETAHLKSTTINNPDGSKNIQYFDRRFGPSEGNLVYAEVYDATDNLLQRSSFEYKEGVDHGTTEMFSYIGEGPFGAPVSWVDEDILNGQSSSSKQLTTKQTIEVFPTTGSGSDVYTTTYSVFDAYDLPKTTYEYNDFNGKKKYTNNYYQHDLVNHLIGLPTQTDVSNDGVSYTQVSRTTYHSATGSYKSLPNYHYDHGRWYKRNTSYHTTGVNAGLPNRVTYNGTNRWVNFSNYKRGKARTISTPQSLSTLPQIATLVVSDEGLVTKVTDFEGHCTYYSYTSIGRLSQILPCDIKQWLHTTISYTTTTGNEGLSHVSSGMLKQTIARGNYEKVNYFDSLFRNRLSLERDKTNSATKRYVRTDYDAFNRPTYQSLASTSSSTIYGVNTEYDGLGRTINVDDNTTSGDIGYEYLTSNRTRVNDNKGNQTTTTYLAYGSPSQQLATYIAAPESTNTTLNYNIYGNITSIAQGGITEHRVYDGYQKLCKTTRPDVGNTAMVYNALNQVTWTAQGSSISNSTTSCDTSVTAADKATYAYDNLGNVKSIIFSDASPDQTYTYDKNSKLTKLVAGNVTTDYEYNDVGLLEKETLSVDSEIFTLDYVFNSNGHLSNLIYPSGVNVSYAPNALGQSTKVGTYATAATYHANGAIKAHQYGNGASYSLTQYSSGMPKSTYDQTTVFECTFCISSLASLNSPVGEARTKKVIGPVLPGPGPVPDPTLPPVTVTTYVLNQSFTYDANNNLTFWDDKYNNAHDFRATYDGLDRLDVITDSYSGTGYFNYDSMGNITNYKIGNKTLTYTYNSNKQLTKVNGFQAKDFAYDSKGNVTNNGENAFVYNTANQMVSSSDGSYVYDGNNKRVKKVDGQGTSYSMYSNAGQLVYRKVNGVHTDYYYLGKKLVAKKKGSTKTYIHTDFLGSPAAETNTLGTVTSRLHYQPFGDTIEAAREDIGYTGHKFDKDLGLSYMQARYYDPVIGRFYSNDPVGFSRVDNFNRYSYVSNNPYKYTDPTGMDRYAIQVAQARSTGRSIEQTTRCSGCAGAGSLFPGMGLKGAYDNIQAGNYLSATLDIAGELPTGKIFKLGKLSKACCFVAGTQVLTKKGYKNIEDVKLGEKLWAKNTKTGEQDWKPVTKIFNEPDRGIYEIKLKGKDGFVQKIEATDDHPFYVIDHGWKTTIELEVGDRIETDGHDAMAVTSVVDQKRQDLTYNFTVADFHTYYVTKRNVLVHNCNIVNKVVNSNMPHAIDQGVARGVFPDAKNASDTLKSLGKKIKKDGFPEGTIKDTANADRVLVPVGNNGYAVYQTGKNGTAKLKTTLIKREQ